MDARALATRSSNASSVSSRPYERRGVRRSEGAVVEVVPLVDDDSYVCRYASDPEDVDDDSRGAVTEEDDPHGDGGVNVLDVVSSDVLNVVSSDVLDVVSSDVLNVVSSDVLDVVSSSSSSSSASQSNVVVAPDEYDDEYVDDVPL